MKRSDILRGQTQFKRLGLTGKRLDGQVLRCAYLVQREKENPLQVAFRVPARYMNAVRRNRLRRLMRVAMDEERPPLDTAIAKGSGSVAMMISYKGGTGVVPNRIGLAQIRRDVGLFCRVVASTL